MNLNFLKFFNYINFFVSLYLIIFSFLLFYAFYRSELVYEGNQLSYYYKYYLISACGIFFWLIVLFLRKKAKKQIILFFTSIIFILYSYETIQFFSPVIYKLDFIKSIQKQKKTESRSNEKSKYDVIQEIKNTTDINVVPSVFPKAFIKKKWINKETDIFPLGGVSNVTTVFCKEGDEFSIYKSDRFGFNNPDSAWDFKEIYWFLVGDSFTQGSCVKQEENFASQIRLLTKQSSVSVGMSGNGPLIEFASLKEYGLSKKPKIVLWFYFERNDLEDLKIEKTSPIFMKYLDKNFTQNLYTKQNEIDKNLRTYIKLAEKNLKNEKKITYEDKKKFLTFEKIIRLQIVREKMSLDRGLDFGINPLFREVMLKAKNIVNDWNGKLFFIYLPDKERYANKNNKDDRYLKKSQVINLIRNLDISIIDIHKDFFMKQTDPMSFYAHRIYGHYSPEGYSEISKVIIKKIIDITGDKVD